MIEISDSDRRFWIQHGWHPVPFNGDVRKTVWCYDVLGYCNTVNHSRIMLFKCKEDAVRFIMTWGGEVGY